MLEYKEINWKTLEFFKTHLYRRLTAPLNETISHLERLQILADEGLRIEKMDDSRLQLEGLLNLVNAWAALISYKDSGSFTAFPHRTFTAPDIPQWIRSYLEERTTLRADFTHPVYVHEETFLEAFYLLYQVASKLGNVSGVQLVNAPPKKPGVFMRVVFTVNPDSSPFLSLDEVEKRFDRDNLAEWDIYMQLAVACDMLALNKGRFTLQNNKKTGQQALAAFFLPHEQTLIEAEREKSRVKTAPFMNTTPSRKTAPLTESAPEPAAAPVPVPAEATAATVASPPAEPAPPVTSPEAPAAPAEEAGKPAEPAPAKSSSPALGNVTKILSDDSAPPVPLDSPSLLGNVTKILADDPDLTSPLGRVTKELLHEAEDQTDEDVRTGLLKLLSRLSSEEIADLVARQKELPPAPEIQAEGEAQAAAPVAQIEGDPRAGETSTDEKTAEGSTNPEEKQG